MTPNSLSGRRSTLVARIRPVQPRIVFGFLLLASVAGVWIVGNGRITVQTVSRWVLIVVFGSTGGGLYWRLICFSQSDDETEALRFLDHRWNDLEARFVIVGLPIGLIWARTAGLYGDPLGHIVLGGLISFVVGIGVVHRVEHDHPDRQAIPRLLAGIGIGLVLFSAALVRIPFGSPLSLVVRLGHLGAFTIWIGGAVWHNVCIVPAMKRYDDHHTIRSQPRRFRRGLPVVIVTILLTGVYQVIDLGVTFRYASSFLGQLVLLKIGILGILIGLVLKQLYQVRKNGNDEVPE